VGAAAIELPFTATISGAEKDILLDLSGVTFLASLGLRVLLAAARVTQRRGRQIVIYGAQPQAQEVFETISMESLVPVASDEASARAALAA
jgi:anti-anti-sigma factor